ncbi:hypothetical protein O181_019484 [Austropuccinia psidii MF-1]|uniref:m7GpppX diphosphatase n=1 Tax=Austropuccinia psidii MF-1 TaxID=1389203 RepID=A0A9Q3GUS4_9BASI|nr:hypothetical protein [Austropuccinia psidii MF-1]
MQDSEGLLRSFKFDKVLNEDPSHHTIHLLGSVACPSFDDVVPAILVANKTHFSNDSDWLSTFTSKDSIQSVKIIGKNDIYHWSLGWLASQRPAYQENPDVKLSLIVPATELHIRKYSKQTQKIIRETPELYKSVVLPYIQSTPSTRLSWLHNILNHQTESERIIYEDPSPTNGFMIIPDLKWDQTTHSSLYLLCIVRDGSIRSLRDLRSKHLPILHAIRSKATQAIEEKYNVPTKELRLFVHYQPSYYHFHVHITHVDHIGFQGIAVGQAHLLDEIIDNLELDAENKSESSKPYFDRRTFVYGLGSHHGLFEFLWSHQDC